MATLREYTGGALSGQPTTLCSDHGWVNKTADGKCPDCERANAAPVLTRDRDGGTVDLAACAAGVNLDERWTTVPTIEEMRAAYTGYKVVKDDMGNNYCVVKREWGTMMADGFEYRPRPVVRVPIVDDDNHAYAVACHIASTLYGAGL